MFRPHFYRAFLVLVLGGMLLSRGGFAQTFSTSSSLKFVPNRGQLSDQNGNPMPEVHYTLEGGGIKTFFTKGSMHYVFSQLERGNHPLTPSFLRRGNPDVEEKDTLSLYRVDEHFIGGNENVEIVPEDSSEDYTNYYLASCPNGITGVHGYRKITYRNLYPNIDLVLYANQANNLEYDFVVHPGGDPKAIKMHYDHATSLFVDESGALRLSSPYGSIADTKPNAYQLRGETKRAISSGFHLSGTDLTIWTGSYDHARDLILDPQRLWGTYFGGLDTSNNTELNDITVDRSGCLEAIGITISNANIATSGAFQTSYAGGWDGYITRFAGNGNLQWSTYYGGSSDDYLLSIASDTSNNIGITGYTFSSSGIASSGAFQTTFNGEFDALLLLFDSLGQRKWGTYFSGNGVYKPPKGNPVESITMGTGIAFDSSMNILFTGETSSSASIATSGAYETSFNGTQTDFVAKFSESGSRTWSTYYGDSAGQDGGSIACDANNNIYFCGTTTSYSDIATSGAYQTSYGPEFFAKFSSNGSRIWGTFYFDSTFPMLYYQLIKRIAVSRSGNLYFAGETSNTDLATPGAFLTTNQDSDGVLGKFNTSGKREWVTYYGGSQPDQFYSLVLDSVENIFASGYTESSNGIATTGEYQTTLLGPFNPFIVKFDSAGHRKWGTYYGRRGAGYAMALDRSGHPFVGGTTWTGTGEYASVGAYQTMPFGYESAFIAKFCDPIELHVSSSVSSPDTVCPGTPMTLSTKTGLASYQWLLNQSNIGGATASTYKFNAPLLAGHYNYTVTGVGTDACDVVSDTFSMYVRQPPVITSQSSFPTCPGVAIKLTDTATGLGHLLYSWSPKTALDFPDSLQPNASPTSTTIYTFSVTDSIGCTATKQITVSVYAQPKLTMSGSQTICVGSSQPLTATASGGLGPYTYLWNPSATLDRADSSTVVATPKVSTIYYVTITDQHGCIAKDSVKVVVNAPPKVSAGAPLSICKSSSIKIGAQISGGLVPYKIQWEPATGLSNPLALNPTASPDSTTLYTIFVTDKNGCSAQDSILVIVSDSLIPTIAAQGPATICAGDSVVLDAGSGYANYLWSDGEKMSSIIVKTSGSYSVHVDNGAGCAGTSSPISITVLPDSIPHPKLTATRTTICEGDSVNVHTTENYASYLWSTGDTTPSIVVKQTDTITLRATNPGGCSGTTAPFVITVLPVPSVAITPSGPISLCGDSLTLSATPGYSTYRWSTGDTTPSVHITASGTYSVSVTNAGGCSATIGPVDVTINSIPNPTIAGPLSVCPNSSSNYSVALFSGDRYSWSLSPSSAGTIQNSNSATMTVQWSAAGTARLILIETNAAGCADTVSVGISITSNLSAIITGPSALCIGDSIVLDAGSGYASYQWSLNGNQMAGATSETLSVSQAGSYTVFVTSAGGCSGTSAPDVIGVDSIAKPTISKIGTKLVASAAYRYQWLRSGTLIADSTSSSILFDSGGSYVVIVTDSLGCSATSDPFTIASTAWAAVSVDNHLAAPDSTVTIHLLLDSTGNISANGLTNFDAVIGLTASMLTPINPAGTLVAGPSEMEWMVPVSGTVPTAPGVLGTLTVHSLDSGLCSAVTIDSISFPGSNVQPIISNGMFCLTGLCRTQITSRVNALYIRGIIPNPAGSDFTLAYHVAEEGPVEISVQDYLGRTAAILKNEWSEPGDMTETYSSSTISSGFYRLILRSAGEIQSSVLMIAK